MRWPRHSVELRVVLIVTGANLGSSVAAEWWHATTTVQIAAATIGAGIAAWACVRARV